MFAMKAFEKERFLLLSILLPILLPACFSFSRVVASPAIGSTRMTLYSVADAYVNSSNPDLNYGSADYMCVSANSEKGFMYVMFDLSSIPSDANIISASLDLYLSSTGGDIYWHPADAIGAYHCADTSWTEIGITWNNQPSFNSEPTDTWSFSMLYFTKEYKSWDVTRDVVAALASGTMTEVLKFVSKTGEGCALFQSREGANKPRLEIEYATQPVFVVHVESVEETGATGDLGLVSFGGETFSLPTEIDVVNGSYRVAYSSGYVFVRWETSGGVRVSDENAESTAVFVSGNGTLRVVGSTKKLEYAYDQGRPQWRSGEVGHIAAVRFTPLSSGQLLTARFYMHVLSQYQSNTFKVHITDKDRGDLIPQFNVTPTSEGWFDVDVSLFDVIVDGSEDFYIGMEWIVDYNPILGEDRTDVSHRSWHWNGESWIAEENSDFMIRAVIGWHAPETISVVKGAWAVYSDISLEYVSNIPGYEEPTAEMNVSWIHTEVLDVSDSSVVARSITIYSNGTERTDVSLGNIASGEGNLSVGIIPVNLGSGDKIPANLTWYTEQPLELFINGTDTRSYAGANREVNYVKITYPIARGNATLGAWNMSFYWDKKTGVICEEIVSHTLSYMANMTHYYMNMSLKYSMTATNMWPAVFRINWNGHEFNVTMISNSTVSNFIFIQPNMEISYNATGPMDKWGYCNVAIPKDLLRDSPWTILLNDTDWTTLCAVTENNTHNFIYIPYTHSTNTIQIIGTWVVAEFASTIILQLFTILSLITIVFLKYGKKW